MAEGEEETAEFFAYDDDDDIEVRKGSEVKVLEAQASNWWRRYTDFQTLIIALMFVAIALLVVIIFLLFGIYLAYYYGEPSLERRIKQEIEDEINDFAALYIQSGECVWESACPALFTALLGASAAETTCNGLGTSDLLQSCGLLSTSLLTTLSYSSTWSSPISSPSS